jgi:hypothetical protein
MLRLSSLPDHSNIRFERVRGKGTQFRHRRVNRGRNITFALIAVNGIIYQSLIGGKIDDENLELVSLANIR